MIVCVFAQRTVDISPRGRWNHPKQKCVFCSMRTEAAQIGLFIRAPGQGVRYPFTKLLGSADTSTCGKSYRWVIRVKFLVDDILKYFFLFFAGNKVWHFMQIATVRDSLKKCLVLFSGQNKKIYISLSYAEFANSMVSIGRHISNVCKKCILPWRVPINNSTGEKNIDQGVWFNCCHWHIHPWWIDQAICGLILNYWSICIRFFSSPEGGGRVVRRCCVSYITGASNWYWLTVGQVLLSL